MSCPKRRLILLLKRVAYTTHFLVGVVALVNLLLLSFSYLTESENLGWLLVGASFVLYVFVAPTAVVFTVISLFGGVDWKLFILLASTLILLAVVYFSMFVRGSLGYSLWFVLLQISYAIVTLPFPIWHLLGERRERATQALFSIWWLIYCAFIVLFIGFLLSNALGNGFLTMLREWLGEPRISRTIIGSLDIWPNTTV